MVSKRNNIASTSSGNLLLDALDSVEWQPPAPSNSTAAASAVRSSSTTASHSTGVRARSFASSPSAAITKKSKSKRIDPSPPARSDENDDDAAGPAGSFIAQLISSKRAEEPDWSSYSLARLREEVKRWGYRSSTSDREELHEKAHSIWLALKPDTLAPARSRASPPRAPPPPESLSRTGTGKSPLLSPTLQTHLLTSIHSDSQLHRRILLMEPVPFEEVWSIAQRHGLVDLLHEHEKKRGWANKLKEEVKVWLDQRGVVWYQGELSGWRRDRR
ncbi:hypothetical protein BDZ90DRAFT_234923 [Jaminaea rosea]|uniref:Structure-specific endonuclease subunit SLX4 n=1 Tax=Jaminaea rosea TaxID=1569628 RepID=A0A316UH53_9BASI|nr:hypothetical protein BDZ90DRAFT_234923 [Jaminaea rosea]PWN24657.1 hypothetical protein BDZ90DRAFT_234923 [Jaminaea rosea]